MNKILKIATIFIATLATGLIGMLFVDSGVGAWYDGLKGPPLMPTDIFFPITWIVIYICMGCACALVWNKPKQNASTEGWVRFYFIQLFLNAGWTIFFFGYHQVTIAFVDTLVLGFMIMGLTASGYDIDKKVTYLMAPYCLWLLFAAYLTAGIWLLN